MTKSSKVESYHRKQCIYALRASLLNLDVPTVIIDVIIGSLFTEYTVYALRYNDSYNMFAEQHRYEIIEHGLNTDNMLFSNNHMFMYQNGNLYASPKSSNQLQRIGKKRAFIVCKETHAEYGFKEHETYLFDNNSRKFYSYNLKKKVLNKVLSKQFKQPPFPIKSITRNLNTHNLEYYWCLMTNGVIFKIVFNHNSCGVFDRRANWHQNYVSECGPFDYHEQVLGGVHTLDLEVFRLLPSKIPKMVDMVSGGDHMLFIDSKHHLWVYGNNKDGQCGIKKSTDTIVQPIKNRMFKDIKVRNIYCSRNRSVIIDYNGLCYIFGEGLTTTDNTPYKLFQSFPGYERCKIRSANCGNDHFVFIDDENNVYGLGSNVYDEPQLMPTRYIANKREKISKVIINGNYDYIITHRNSRHRER